MLGYIIFLAIGLALIDFAIYAKVQNQQYLHKGIKVNAQVVSSTKSSIKVGGETVTVFDNVIEFSTRIGVMQKTLKEEHERKVDSQLRGYYLEKKDRFMMESSVEENQGKGPWILLWFGIGWCVLILLAWWMEVSYLGAVIASRVFAYGISLTFIVIGVWIGVLTPKRRKQQKPDTHIVKAKLVDFIENIYDEDGRTYQPIYEYEVYGEARHYQPSVSGSSKKYRQIGRITNLVINDVTGEVYSEEEDKTSSRLGLLFLIIGLLAGGAVLANDVIQLQNGNLTPLFREAEEE